MKKNLHFLLSLFIGSLCFAQTGIGTATPQQSAILDLSSTNKALLLSRVNGTAAITTPQNGMVVYDTSTSCIKMYQNGAWSECIYTLPGTIASIDCSGTPHNGKLKEGTPAQETYSVIAYTGGNGALHHGQSIASTGVTGLTATLGAGNFISGNGTLVYNITGIPNGPGTATFATNIGGKTCSLTRTVIPAIATLASLNCAGATTSGPLYNDTPATSITLTIPYTGGNTGEYAGQTINSTGVTGLIATLTEGQLASGNGQLVFSLSGTPSANGTAAFPISIGGQTCTVNVTVAVMPAGIPATITLAQSQRYLIGSIYDTDYLPYTIPTVAATGTALAANGTTDPTVDFQGTITTAGVGIKIPVTATGSGSLPAYTSPKISIPATLTQDGVARDIVLSWPSQTYTTATTNIDATVKAIGGTVNVKKLDMNTGIGNDGLGVALSAITYPYNSTNTTTTFTVRAISGIPDRMYGVADNSASTTSHRFVYVPVMGEDGKVWLNNNLGADYSNIGKAVFNPTKQATTSSDYNAYGSLYQWGRKSDGHELVNWTSATAGTLTGTSGSTSDIPTHALLIVPPTFDWRVTANSSLWNAETATNNPCPRGFRVPTLTEINSYISASGITSLTTGAIANLKYTATGFRQSSGNLLNPGISGYYWSSSAVGSDSSYLNISNGTGTTSTNRYYAFSVRCIKN